MATWGIARAKAQLSEVIYEAERRGPQKLSRSGREVAVVVSLQEWERLSATPPSEGAKESLADFIMKSPFHGLKIPKFKLRPRKFEL